MDPENATVVSARAVPRPEQGSIYDTLNELNATMYRIDQVACQLRSGVAPCDVMGVRECAVSTDARTLAESILERAWRIEGVLREARTLLGTPEIDLHAEEAGPTPPATRAVVSY